MTRLIDADALLEVIEKRFGVTKYMQPFIDAITNAPTVQRELSLTNSKYKTVMHCLNKISEFCPSDENVNKLDESPENMIRLSFAEIWDTARSAIAAILATEPVVHREGWVSVNDRLPEFECSVLCYRQSDDWQVVADYIYPAFWIDFSEGKVAHAITHWQPLPSAPKE